LIDADPLIKITKSCDANHAICLRAEWELMRSWLLPWFISGLFLWSQRMWSRSLMWLL